jgi:hypothetical protein
MASSKLDVVRTRTPSSVSGFSALMAEKRKSEPIKRVAKKFILKINKYEETEMIAHMKIPRNHKSDGD